MDAVSLIPNVKFCRRLNVAGIRVTASTNDFIGEFEIDYLDTPIEMFVFNSLFTTLFPGRITMRVDLTKPH